MLSWPVLHVSSPYTTGLNIRKSRDYFLIATAHVAHAQPMSQHTIEPLPILQEPTQHVLTRFGEA